MADETTSPEIATHAGRIVQMDDVEIATLAITNPELFRRVAASALTQAADRAEPTEEHGSPTE